MTSAPERSLSYACNGSGLGFFGLLHMSRRKSRSGGSMRPLFALRRLRSARWPRVLAGAALYLTGMIPAHAQSAPASEDSLQMLQTVTVEGARIVTRTQAIEAKKKAPNII